MTEEPVERRGRSSSMGMSSNPTTHRLSPPRVSPINFNPSINSKGMSIKTGSRLRAATSFSPYHSPSGMAVRRTGIVSAGNVGKIGNGAYGKSLAAVAGPMGITVVDVAAPQRPWLVLNYSSSVESSSSSGITTMAFQPCPSTLQPSDLDKKGSTSYKGDGYNYHAQSSPVLLATARGSGILIWDCSGRALSPLLGRLNASDSWSGGGSGNSKTVNNLTSNSGSKRNVDDDSMESGEESGTNSSQPSPLIKAESNPQSTTRDTFKSLMCSPNSTHSYERGNSLVSVSSSSSLVASNANNLLTNIGNHNGLVSSVIGSSAAKAPPKENVTSLDWKGPSAPILLSTCGTSASIWDLRTSLLSQAAGSAGARPNIRFLCPEDGLYNADSRFIHCAYSRDESKHIFATLENTGVVRVWDDRKADQPRSFLACPGGGVGIASIAPCKDSSEPCWVTWGLDDGQQSDDLVVKVWADTSKTAGGCESCAAYNVISQISMAGGVAARVHPSFQDSLLLFRDNPSSQEHGIQKTSGGISIGEIEEGSEGILKSPNQTMILPTGLKMRASPEMVIVQTPPSPPPLMLEETTKEREPDEPASANNHTHKGWEAELWQIDLKPLELADTVGAREERTFGAQKTTAFCGGGDEEDALSFVPGRGDVSGVIAAELATSPTDSGNELSCCVLTKAGRLTVYGVPEATVHLSHEEKTTESTTSKQGRLDAETMSKRSSHVYRQSADRSPWWNKNEEEDLFGEVNTAQDSPKKSSMVADSDSAVRVTRMQESSGEPASAAPIIPKMDELNGEREVDTSTSVDVQKPLDHAMAARVPCPPLCGVAFSGVGELVTFNNGPVRKAWSYYQSNESLTPTGPSTAKLSATSDEDESSMNNETHAGQRMPSAEKQVLPRTLGDLIEMNLRSQTLQWGDDQQNNDSPSDDGSSSSDSSSYSDPELTVLESDDSGGVSDSDDSEGFYHVSGSGSGSARKEENLDNMFQNYFATSRKSLLGESHTNEEKYVGLPSLSPAVTVTREYNDIILRGQSPDLANKLLLGDVWWLTANFQVPDSDLSGDRHQDNFSLEDNDNSATFLRNSSDPYLSSTFADMNLARSSSFSPTTKSKHTSMIGNLKRLFVNQLPTAMTPPDQRLLKSKTSQKNFQVDQASIRPNRGSSNVEGVNEVKLGVYMLENPQTPEGASERLAVTHKICIHNAQICLKCGQKAKADTWTLLAQTVESIFTFESDDTDGWGGAEDALTNGIVEQLLRYYEGLGDFQMLSTIVCVLTFGRDRRRDDMSRDRRDPTRNSSGRYQLLPKFDERRYDNYLHRYAELLYGWGILTVRSELSKRLAYSTPGAGAETILQETIDSTKSSLLPNSAANPGITFSPVCGKCMETVTDANGICPKCEEYAFQCSICCSAVRGACTFCPLCGHGGHVDHMIQWFQNHTVCPTGCGCTCIEGNPSNSQHRTNIDSYLLEAQL